MATGSNANTAKRKSTEKSPCTILAPGAPWYSQEELATPAPKWPAAVRDKKFGGQVEMLDLPVYSIEQLVAMRKQRSLKGKQ